MFKFLPFGGRTKDAFGSTLLCVLRDGEEYLEVEIGLGKGLVSDSAAHKSSAQYQTCLRMENHIRVQ